MTATSPEKAVEASRNSAQSSLNWRLFIVSVAALYLEIVLIRWIGTEVRIFAFFQNLSLIACFLGFGLGCFSAKERGSLLPSMTATCILVFMVNSPSQMWRNLLRGMSAFLALKPDADLWGFGFLGSLSTLDYWRLTAFSVAVLWLFLLLMVNAMIPLGRWVGYYLETAPDAVTSYSVNLAGSIAGLWLLAILALFWLPPPCWFAVAFALMMVSQPFSWRSVLAGCALLAVTLFLLRTPSSSLVYWSPYQKLQVTPTGDQQYGIEVNNVGYMTIANVSPEVLSHNPEVLRNYQNSSYDSPFRFAEQLNRVLVIGAGAGNDAAAALRHGAKQVDAVEIDPLIYSLGKQLHPEHPYDSPKVHISINDARNFLRQPHAGYDVIIFGLLDSHTEFSGYSNMRIDNYVYTEEAFRDAKRLLAPDGILILKFEVRKPWEWMGQRFYTMLDGIFRHAPVTYYRPQEGLRGGLLQASVFIESESPHLWQRASQPDMAAFVSGNPPVFPLSAQAAPPPPTTDDWPYVYNRSHSIPRTYLTVSVILLLLTLRRVWRFLKPRETSTWTFFLLGAGFLLMETQLISRLALYFGTTWLVNCIALTGILTVLLIASLYVKRNRPGNLVLYYAWLCLGLLASYVIPWNRIPGPGMLVGSLLCLAYCVPVFFAGVVFTETFRRSSERSYAFGANILGAVAGGLAQSLSFIVGLKALLILAVVVYATAAILQSKGRIRLASQITPA